MADPIRMQHPDFKARHLAGRKEKTTLLTPGIRICESSHLHMGTQEDSNEGQKPRKKLLVPSMTALP